MREYGLLCSSGVDEKLATSQNPYSCFSESLCPTCPPQADCHPFSSRGGNKHLCEVLLPQTSEGSPDWGQEGTNTFWEK